MPEQEAVAQELETPVAAPEETQEVAETAAVPETAPTESEEEQEEKRQSGVQRRIDKLTREKYELSGQARELRERIAALERNQASKPAATQASDAAQDPKPDPKTFTGTYEEFVEALSRWTARQEHKALAEKTQKEQETADQQERDREVVDSYQERSSEFAAEKEDFNEVVGRIKIAADVAPGVQVAIMEDENGPALAYFLGQHPEVCQQLSELSPARALTHLGRISAALFPDATEESDSEDSPSPKAARPAPAPLKPVKKVAPTDSGLSDDEPMDKWLAKRQKQLQAAGRKI